jgi:hypothetical protein
MTLAARDEPAQIGIPVECGSVKRLEVLGRGWSGPEVRTSGRGEPTST